MASNGTPVLRIASASGSVTDRREGFKDLAENEDVHFIVGDWMSEYNMTSRAGGKIANNGSSEEFEPSFLEAFIPSLPYLSKNKIRVAVNAGASSTEALYHVVVNEVKKAGLDLKVAWVGGDEVMDTVKTAADSGTEFKNLTTGMITPPKFT